MRCVVVQPRSVLLTWSKRSSICIERGGRARERDRDRDRKRDSDSDRDGDRQAGKT